MGKENTGEPENVQQVVRAILVTVDGFVCIGNRSPGSTEGGKWCLVGGKAEGSDLNAELFREIVEETGTPIEDLTDVTEAMFSHSEDRERGGVVWRNNYFILEIDDIQVPAVLINFNQEEFSEVAFITADDLEGLEFAEWDKDVIMDFLENVGN